MDIDNKRINIDRILFEELIADQIHEVWAEWAGYMIMDCGIQNDDGTVTLPKEKVDRWTRQMITQYDELPEEERETDRTIARECLVKIFGEPVG